MANRETRGQPFSALAGRIRQVKEQDSGLLARPDALREALLSAGASPVEAAQVELMARVTGFAELIDPTVPAPQAVLERYIYHAIRESGLSRTVVWKRAGELAWGVGSAVDITSLVPPEDTDIEKGSYVAPASVYEEELNQFGQALFGGGTVGQSNAGNLNFDLLTAGLALGIPRARYYLGYCLLHGTGIAQSREEGIRLLQQAADGGCLPAAAALADCYYEDGPVHWPAAWALYTGPGAVCLDDARQKRVRAILAQQQWNRTLAIGVSILAVLALVLAVALPREGLYAVSSLWRWLGAAAAVAGTGLGWWRLFQQPCGRLSWMPVGALACWAILILGMLL